MSPANDKLTVGMNAGTIGHSSHAYLKLFPGGQPKAEQEDDDALAVATAAVPSGETQPEIILQSQHAGLHRLHIDVPGGASLTWQPGVPMTIAADLKANYRFVGSYSLYFYVPKGTKIVGGYSGGPGQLMDGSGKAIYTFDKNAAYFKVPVAAGQDGKLWKFNHCGGQHLLMTVPPYLARSGEELLLPREVVEADAPH